LPGFQAEVFTEDEFEKIMADFVLAAKMTYDVGADGIDMKFCHGTCPDPASIRLQKWRRRWRIANTA
jgi:hypothetical protein